VELLEDRRVLSAGGLLSGTDLLVRPAGLSVLTGELSPGGKPAETPAVETVISSITHATPAANGIGLLNALATDVDVGISVPSADVAVSLKVGAADGLGLEVSGAVRVGGVQGVDLGVGAQVDLGSTGLGSGVHETAEHGGSNVLTLNAGGAVRTGDLPSLPVQGTVKAGSGNTGAQVVVNGSLGLTSDPGVSLGGHVALGVGTDLGGLPDVRPGVHLPGSESLPILGSGQAHQSLPPGAGVALAGDTLPAAQPSRAESNLLAGVDFIPGPAPSNLPDEVTVDQTTAALLAPSLPTGSSQTLDNLLAEPAQAQTWQWLVGGEEEANAETATETAPDLLASASLNDLALPSSTGLLADAAPADLAALDRALGQFLDQLAGLRQELTGWLARVGPLPWVLLGAALAVTAHELFRRRLRRSLGLLSAAGGDDLAPAWLPGWGGFPGGDES
jgi:hypothetical protein